VIFVTVGGQKPFDRLVRCVDEWAAQRPDVEVFAQIGDSREVPNHIQWEHFMTPVEFTQVAREAEVIVAHAGMGTILTSLEVGTPILVMPRKASLGEHRSDHQIATVKRLREVTGIPVADDEKVLHRSLDRLLELGVMEARGGSRSELVAVLREFIWKPVR
jgi:UDP-N-acetylglucosamine transferase subunit ALG13